MGSLPACAWTLCLQACVLRGVAAAAPARCRTSMSGGPPELSSHVGCVGQIARRGRARAAAPSVTAAAGGESGRPVRRGRCRCDRARALPDRAARPGCRGGRKDDCPTCTAVEKLSTRPMWPISRVARGIGRRLQGLEQTVVGLAEAIEVAGRARHPVVARGGERALLRVGLVEEGEPGAQLRVALGQGVDRDVDGRAEHLRRADGAAACGVERQKLLGLIADHEEVRARVVEGHPRGMVAGQRPQRGGGDAVVEVEGDQILAAAHQGPGDVVVGVQGRPRTVARRPRAARWGRRC